MWLKRADIKVWFACNNQCDFCVQWDKRKKFKQRTFDEIKEILDREYKEGARTLVFTWWEPTIHTKLIESVAYAKSVWYVEIQIQSNWYKFSDMEYSTKLIKAWVTEFSPSIHGFKAETHDKQVKHPWAWKKVVEWMINLKKLKQRIIINSVITKDNYKEIPELSALLVKIWVSQFQFAFVHILWSAAKNKETVVPKKSDVMPYIKKWLDLAKKHRIPAFTEAIPYCLMQWYEYAIAEQIIPEMSISDAQARVDSYSDYRWNEWKAKREECKKCSKYKICEWPWKEYPEIYGWDEFKPI